MKRLQDIPTIFHNIDIFKGKKSLTTKRATSVALWTAMLFGVISVSNKITTCQEHSIRTLIFYSKETGPIQHPVTRNP